MIYMNSSSSHQHEMLGSIMNMRWNQYVEKYKIDGIFCYDPKKGILVTIYEGTGSNLSEEDEAAGCKDYWNVDVGMFGVGFDDGGMICVKDVIRERNPYIAEILDLIERNGTMIEGIFGLPLKSMIMNPFLGNKMEHAIYEEERKKK